jgi:hypothetical protein
VVVHASPVTAKASIPARVRLEVTIDRGDGRANRHALTLPADAVGLVGKAFVEVARANRRL